MVSVEQTLMQKWYNLVHNLLIYNEFEIFMSTYNVLVSDQVELTQFFSFSRIIINNNII